MTSNFFQQSQQAYTAATGTTSTGRNVVFKRDPTVNDVNYPLGQFWQNTTLGNLWYLNAFTSFSGLLQADWINIGTGSTPLDALIVQSGTSPVVPDGSGQITFNGAVVAAGTNPVRTDGTGPNTVALEVQISQAIAAPNASNIGLLSANSAHFSIDSTGFLSLLGGGQAVDSFQPDTGTNPVVPTALGLVSIRGQTVPNVSGIQVTGALNELDIAMFSPFMGSFVFTNAASGTTQAISVMNTSNTAGSNAVVEIDTAGVSAGIAIVLYTNGVSNAWSSGIASTASAPYIISSSNSLGSPRLEISTTGAVTFNNAYTFPTADGAAGQALITNGAGQLSFQDTSSLYTYTAVSTSPYVVVGTDDYLSVDTSTAKTIQLPNSTVVGRAIIIKDRTGTASTNNITVTTVGGVVTIDGGTSFVMNTNFEAVNLIFNGTSYEVF